MSLPENPKISADREYRKMAQTHFKKQMGADYHLYASARHRLSVSNYSVLNQDDSYLAALKINIRAAQEMLAEIESGLIRGFFTLDQLKSNPEDSDITPAQFLALCERFNYFSCYAFCAVPEFFDLQNGIDEIYDVEGYSDYKLFLKARGSVDDQFRFFYDLTSFLVLPNGCRDSLGSSRVSVMCAPEEALCQFAFRLQPVAQFRVAVGDFFDIDEESPN